MNTKIIDKILSHYVINNNLNMCQFQPPSSRAQKTLIENQYYKGFQSSYKIVMKEREKEKVVFPECFEDDIKDRIQKVISWRTQLKELLKTPLIQQKTKEWYDLRQQCLTASDFAQALNKGKFGKPIDTVIKKSYNHDKEMNFKYPLWWGQKYEDTAIAIYEHVMNTKIYEFGLMKNPHHDFFGASPDGISELGVMLEIKCPYKRPPTLNPIIPEQYYYQIQGQLHTCELKSCDYLDCFIQEFSSRETFFNDLERYSSYGPKFVGNKVFYGIILAKFLDRDNGETPDSYELNELYPLRSPVNMKYQDLLEWEKENIPYHECSNGSSSYTQYEEQETNKVSAYDEDEEMLLQSFQSKKQKMEEDQNIINEPPKYKVIYWKCYEHHIINTELNEKFFNQKISMLSNLWKQILEYRKYFVENKTYHNDHYDFFQKNELKQ